MEAWGTRVFGCSNTFCPTLKDGLFGQQRFSIEPEEKRAELAASEAHETTKAYRLTEGSALHTSCLMLKPTQRDSLPLERIGPKRKEEARRELSGTERAEAFFEKSGVSGRIQSKAARGLGMRNGTQPMNVRTGWMNEDSDPLYNPEAPIGFGLWKTRARSKTTPRELVVRGLKTRLFEDPKSIELEPLGKETTWVLFVRVLPSFPANRTKQFCGTNASFRLVDLFWNPHPFFPGERRKQVKI